MIIEIALGVLLGGILLAYLDSIVGLAIGLLYVALAIVAVGAIWMLGTYCYEWLGDTLLPYKQPINNVIQIIAMTLFWGFVFAFITISIYRSYKNKTLLMDTVKLIKTPMFVVAVITMSFFVYLAYFVK